MSRLKKWLDKRSGLKKSGYAEGTPTVDDFIYQLQEELGPTACKVFWKIVKSNTPLFLQNAYSGPEDKILQFVERCSKDQKFKEEVMAKLPSNFHRSMFEKSMVEFGIFASKLIKNLSVKDLAPEILEKAPKAKDWTRITNKHDSDASLLVDHKPHAIDHPAPQEYVNMMNNKNLKWEHHKLDQNGISAKMVHEIDDGTGQDLYMTKPYHKKMESGTRNWVKNPILGWATMATKGLFHAAGLKNNIEDVSVHEHEGVPLTVHKFAPGHISANSGQQYNMHVDPVQVHKIGVIDYLTNNLDRHHGNLMLNSEVNEESGAHDLLAIDHERNFQYHKTLDQIKRRSPYEVPPPREETPFSYIKRSALNDQHRKNAGWYSHEELTDWWTNHGPAMKEELEKHLGSIKDQDHREHIRDNFNNRWDKMNQWANRVKNGEIDKYEMSALHEGFGNTHNIPMKSVRISQSQLKQLPKNKRDALFAIADIVNKKPKLSSKQTYMLSTAIEGIFQKMTPEEAGEAFKSLVHNPYLSTKSVEKNPDVDPRKKMLNHFLHSQGWDAQQNPIYKPDHMLAIASAIDELPDDKKEIYKRWAEYLREKVSSMRPAA